LKFPGRIKNISMDTKINDFSSIEKKLDSFLRPVNPEESFAVNLKHRLQIEPGITIEKPDYLFVLLFIGSLFTAGIVLVWLLHRILNRNSD
jgi:hypothetical protein